MLLRAFLALFAVLALQATPAYAAPSDDSAGGPERDEYDFSWLDPEKNIYVVQNRKFPKAQHFEIGTGYGVGIGETYRKQRQWNYRATYYFTEHWGVSGFGFSNFNSENDDFLTLRGQGTFPAVRDTTQYVGGSVVWLPFYGKINLFNQIFYIDWHFDLGIGSATTEIDLNTRATGSALIETANYSAFHWGTGWKFFIDRRWGARIDFLATYYKAPNGVGGTVEGSPENNYDNYYFTLGACYTF